MIYADDTHIYAFKSSGHHDAIIAKLEACISDIRSWSIANDMKLDDEKTELIHISSRFRTASPISPLKIGDALVEPAEEARILGGNT